MNNAASGVKSAVVDRSLNSVYSSDDEEDRDEKSGARQIRLNLRADVNCHP